MDRGAEPATARHGAAARLRARWGGQLDPDELSALLVEYRRTGDRRLRNRIVESQRQLVEHHVQRYSRGHRAPADDLRQTALLALIGAVDRFDPDAGASLRTFADRTIDGQLKRYLRDRTWVVRPPRSVQESHLHVRGAIDDLAHELRRSPTVPELSERLGIDEERVIEGLVASDARDCVSIQRPSQQDEGTSLEDTLGDVDTRIDLTDDRVSVRHVIDRLDARQSEVLRLRFFEGLSQPEIARRFDISQSYVSRLIRGASSQLRAELDDSGQEQTRDPHRRMSP